MYSTMKSKLPGKVYFLLNSRCSSWLQMKTSLPVLGDREPPWLGKRRPR